MPQIRFPVPIRIVMHCFALFVCAFLALSIVGCGDDGGPGAPPADETPRLAGGGRSADDDAFSGGIEGSGPVEPPGRPPLVDPPAGYIPVFISALNCFEVPFERVITTRDEWEAWWETATSCLPSWDPPPPPPPDPDPDPDPVDSTKGDGDDDGDEGEGDDDSSSVGDDGGGDRGGDDNGGGIGSGTADSGWVDPGFPGDPFPEDAPEVDFDNNVVIALAVEADSGQGRFIWIKNVEGGAGGTTVTYEVAQLGEDCLDLLMRPDAIPPVTATPTIAFVVPKPVAEPVSFQRNDVTLHCTWEPDPTLPITLYYSDAECELGEGESVITDSTRWNEWLESAWACDANRWTDPGEPSKPGDVDDATGGPDGTPGDPEPVEPPTRWIGVDVDFTTHAVIVLRAEAQTRWGGGIWLNSIERTEGGTTIDYSVMQPSEDCPSIDSVRKLYPTVAIRVPLPLPAPIEFEQHVESIDCHWDGDDGGPRPLPPVGDPGNPGEPGDPPSDPSDPSDSTKEDGSR